MLPVRIELERFAESLRPVLGWLRAAAAALFLGVTVAILEPERAALAALVATLGGGFLLLRRLNGARLPRRRRSAPPARRPKCDGMAPLDAPTGKARAPERT